MAFDGTRPGLGEARLTALVAALTAGLPTLAALLGLDDWTRPLIAAPFGPVRPEHIRRGDLRALWKPQENGTAGTGNGPVAGGLPGGSIRIRVCAGDDRNGLDFSSRLEYIDQTENSGRQVTLHTAVYGFLHADAFRDLDPDLQAERIEIARERVGDWIRATLNHIDNKTLVLASQEYWPVGGPMSDRLSRCSAEVGYKGSFQRGFGDNEVAYGVHVVHTGLIA